METLQVVISQSLTSSRSVGIAGVRQRSTIQEEGLGAVLAGFVFWVGNRVDIWMASTFYDIVPADILFGIKIPQGQNSYYKLVGTSAIMRRFVQRPLNSCELQGRSGRMTGGYPHR